MTHEIICLVDNSSSMKFVKSKVISGFNRFELTGSGVHGFLDRMLCGRVPRKPGRVGLAYLLNHHGMLKSEATIATLPDGRVWYGSAAASEFHDMDWLQHHVQPGDESGNVLSQPVLPTR